MGFLSEASVDQARIYVGVGPCWYWDPRFVVDTFFPQTESSTVRWVGILPPIFVYRSPFLYYGLYGHGPHRFGDFHYPYGHGFEPRGGFHGGGFHGPAVPRRGRPKELQ